MQQRKFKVWEGGLVQFPLLDKGGLLSDDALAAASFSMLVEGGIDGHCALFKFISREIRPTSLKLGRGWETEEGNPPLPMGFSLDISRSSRMIKVVGKH